MSMGRWGRFVYEEVGRCVYGEVREICLWGGEGDMSMRRWGDVSWGGEGDVSMTLYICLLATTDVQVLQCCSVA